jgi:hypothetical protein
MCKVYIQSCGIKYHVVRRQQTEPSCRLILLVSGVVHFSALMMEAVCSFATCGCLGTTQCCDGADRIFMITAVSTHIQHISLCYAFVSNNCKLNAHLNVNVSIHSLSDLVIVENEPQM